MGLLSEGEPLSWEETSRLADHIRRHGVIQFLNSYKKLQNRQGDDLKWGDEVEYLIVKFDCAKKVARLSLKGQQLLDILQKPKKRGDTDLNSIWVPEYGAYMIEGTPGVPYGKGGLISQFNRIEDNMRMRRREVQALLDDDERIFSITNFPRLGCPEFTFPIAYPEPETSFTRSIFWPDSATFLGHPRFKTLSRNIRERRGEKVAINVPIFQDKYSSLALDKDPGSKLPRANPGHVCCDAMGFGMGMCCLQITFQATNATEAEVLYDQLAPLCPILLALTAATPTCRGFLVDKDCRWDAIAASVDCRTAEERGEEPLTKRKFVIPKSRYDSISTYLSDDSLNHNYNDIDLVYDKEIYDDLRSQGIKELIAKHVSHLFIRDSISIFSKLVDQNDEEETDHFENINSTNWQTMRFKLPPPNSSIGWRVEFRPCELQFTDFENASIVCFVVLLTRCILSYNNNLLIPISLVDENMKRAQERDAVLNQKFYFRTNITEVRSQDTGPKIREMTIDEIMNGSSDFPGFLPLVKDYLSNLDVDTDTMCTLVNYWNFISKRASGELMTNAKYIRDFVLQHPEYKQDSVITDSINFDLLKNIDKITEGEIRVEKLLGDFKTKSKN